MKAARIVFSDAALSDILEQSDWYHDRAGPKLAQRWEEGVSSTLLRIAKRP